MTNQRQTLAGHALEALVCPGCGRRLVISPLGAECPTCEYHYGYTTVDQLDLRLRQPKQHTLAVKIPVEPPTPKGVKLGTFEQSPRPQVDFGQTTTPWHINSAILSHFPRASSPESLALDLGCGDGANRPACEAAGFTYVGSDIRSAGASVLADAHALPFADETFEFVISIAVLEHLHNPLVAMREVHRTMKPSAVFIGSVAFLEPFHDESFYHHSHLGVYNSLTQAGFHVTHIGTWPRWSALVAQSKALFPRMPSFLSRSLIAPLYLIHRGWWRVGGLFSAKSSEVTRLLKTAGSFVFVCHKGDA